MTHLTIITPFGEKTGTIAAPDGMPTDLVPGEVLEISHDGIHVERYLYCDKWRLWNGKQWMMGGAMCLIPPAASPDEIIKLRRELLTMYGWLNEFPPSP
ncbi:MAG: hypothetical protein J0M04_22945 [Verrucomicrobia bacterium]|nr:hypothetical protein [Verrucomicrobiota bacterium]